MLTHAQCMQYILWNVFFPIVRLVQKANTLLFFIFFFKKKGTLYYFGSPRIVWICNTFFNSCQSSPPLSFLSSFFFSLSLSLSLCSVFVLFSSEFQFICVLNIIDCSFIHSGVCFCKYPMCFVLFPSFSFSLSLSLFPPIRITPSPNPTSQTKSKHSLVVLVCARCADRNNCRALVRPFQYQKQIKNQTDCEFVQVYFVSPLCPLILDWTQLNYSVSRNQLSTIGLVPVAVSFFLSLSLFLTLTLLLSQFFSQHAKACI